jgi:hypothetical protein
MVSWLCVSEAEAARVVSRLFEETVVGGYGR